MNSNTVLQLIFYKNGVINKLSKKKNTMKKMLFILLATLNTALCSASMDANLSTIRKETRFLTDKMAYELNLTLDQYNDVYEINYDFIYNARNVMDHVLYGYQWALDYYYDYLDMRNDDLRWVLSYSQYNRFLRTEYFYRPIYTSGSRWSFRIYTRYTNHSHYYFPRPYHYRSYVGGHCRTYHNNVSYYRGRHNHQHYTSNNFLIRNNHSYSTHRQADFSSVNVRSNTREKPANVNLNTTRRVSNATGNNGSTRTDNNNRATNSNRTTTPSGSRSSSTSSGNSSSTSRTTTNSGSNNDKSNTRSSSSGARSSSSTRTTGSETKSKTNSSTRSTTTKSNVQNKREGSSNVRSSSGSSTRSSGNSSTRSSSGSSRQSSGSNR